MKKLIIGITFVGLAAAMLFCGFVPTFPPSSCNNDFHPHLDNFEGKPEEVLRFLDGIANGAVEFTAWGANAQGVPELARVIITASYKGKMMFLTLNGNPTLFSPGDPGNYLNRNTSELKKVESKDGKKAVQNAVGCLRDSYAQLSGVKVSAPVTAPSALPAVNFQLVYISAAVLLTLGGGGLVLKAKLA